MVLLWNETQQWSCPVNFTVPPEALVADLSVLITGGWPSSIQRVWEIIVMSEAVSSCKRAGWPLIRKETYFRRSAALDWKEAIKLRDFTVFFVLCLENREHLGCCELFGVFWQNPSLCPIFLHSWQQFWRNRQSRWKCHAPQCLQGKGEFC